MEIKNLWPDFDDAFEIVTPKEILEQQSKFLPKQTGDLVYADIQEISEGELSQYDESLQLDFAFKYILKSKFIDKYKFEVFTFYHDISIYPVKIKLDFDIAREIGRSVKTLNISDEDAFNLLIEEVFSSKRLRLIVGSMMKLAK